MAKIEGDGKMAGRNVVPGLCGARGAVLPSGAGTHLAELGKHAPSDPLRGLQDAMSLRATEVINDLGEG